LPLAVPDPYLTFKRQTLEQYAAARLFVERATAAQPAFRISDENAMAIASICQRLDGIPLALELAAARVRALSVEKIEARLCDRFRLLTGGDRTALPRQQTLRALIDWSYDLLAETERALLRRLAVFAGGWTLEGAEAVGAGGDLDAIDVLDLLTNLVEKSLVVLDAEGERYRLLETVREYALERLDGSGDGDGARTRHLEFHVALAEEADPKLRGVEQGAWASRLDLELENLLAAHTWCDRLEGGAEPGLRLAYAVRLYWLNRGLVELGYRVTTEALARSGAQVAGPHRCRALFAAGQQAFFMGRYRDAEAHLTASVAMARQIGDKGRIAAGLQLLGMAAHGQGDVAIARAHLTESLAIARESGDRERLPFSLSSLAELHRAEGDLDAAEPLYEEALVLDRERGDQADCAVNLLNLTMVAIGRGRWERARATLQEALGIVVAIRSRQGGQAVLDVSAGFAAACEDWERCARLYGAAQTQLTRTSLHRDPADKAFLEPLIAAARAALGQAAFGALEAAGGELDYEAAMAEARAWLTAGLSVSA
jgi:predicted ATPase